jgi:adenosylhomocysteine nucleosidase
MTGVTAARHAGSDYFEGQLSGVDAVVVQCGVGKVNAALCAQILCDIYGVTHLVNTGIAGSLCADLDIGDLVVSKDAIYHDFDISYFGRAVGEVPGMGVIAFPADQTMIESAFAAAEGVNPGHTKIGRIASGDQFVCSKEKKEKIIADTHAICTEMEGAAIAHTAYRNGVPFVILRAISDKADDSAEMDYPTFEAIAAKRCAEVTIALAEKL